MALQVCYHFMCISGVKSHARTVLGERKYGLIRGAVLISGVSLERCPHFEGVLTEGFRSTVFSPNTQSSIGQGTLWGELIVPVTQICPFSEAVQSVL